MDNRNFSEILNSYMAEKKPATETLDDSPIKDFKSEISNIFYEPISPMKMDIFLKNSPEQSVAFYKIQAVFSDFPMENDPKVEKIDQIPQSPSLKITLSIDVSKLNFAEKQALDRLIHRGATPTKSKKLQQDLLKKNFRTLAKVHHPDLYNGDLDVNVNRVFQEIHEDYEILNRVLEGQKRVA